jgi:hypothetical protein
MTDPMQWCLQLKHIHSRTIENVRIVIHTIITKVLPGAIANIITSYSLKTVGEDTLYSLIHDEDISLIIREMIIAEYKSIFYTRYYEISRYSFGEYIPIVCDIITAQQSTYTVDTWDLKMYHYKHHKSNSYLLRCSISGISLDDVYDLYLKNKSHRHGLSSYTEQLYLTYGSTIDEINSKI